MLVVQGRKHPGFIHGGDGPRRIVGLKHEQFGLHGVGDGFDKNRNLRRSPAHPALQALVPVDQLVGAVLSCVDSQRQLAQARRRGTLSRASTQGLERGADAFDGHHPQTRRSGHSVLMRVRTPVCKIHCSDLVHDPGPPWFTGRHRSALAGDPRTQEETLLAAKAPDGSRRMRACEKVGRPPDRVDTGDRMRSGARPRALPG